MVETELSSRFNKNCIGVTTSKDQNWLDECEEPIASCTALDYKSGLCTPITFTQSWLPLNRPNFCLTFT